MTLGMIWLTYIIAAAMIRACVVALIVIGIVLLTISIAWGIYDRVKGRKKHG